MLLARARGLESIRVKLPSQLASLPPRNFTEMRLVWDQASCRYHWHLVVEDGQPNAEPPGGGVVAGDPGEIHPITLTDGDTAEMACGSVALETQEAAPL